MEESAALLRFYGCDEEEIASLARWDRVRRIAEFSTRAAHKGSKAAQRFARGQRTSMQAQQSVHKKKAMEVFERQMRLLSITWDDEASESDNDIDDFAEDLEGLLDADDPTDAAARRVAQDEDDKEVDEALALAGAYGEQGLSADAFVTYIYICFF